MDDDDIVSLETCYQIMQLVYLVKDVICEYKPCSFNSICWPSILDTFPFGKVLLLSYLYGYSLLKPTFVVSIISQTADIVCWGRMGQALGFWQGIDGGTGRTTRAVSLFDIYARVAKAGVRV
ncbi:hypothetical protein P691DRAFT_838263 [Macrolepiota fuliginosa MF-IS2]|uniref:Uncharacterized protein n=1 Tax=Macrolepiota fuliginosa MF-IS2 TaxID=1400762 RepID=A0A9P5X3M7_9AGAR|nr:hypothetical protein P691DRAFT_838263 [Macrolepiota fuliginosa MF-IS2]